MGSISNAIGKSLNVRADCGKSAFQVINLRNRLHRDLTDLLTHSELESNAEHLDEMDELDELHEVLDSRGKLHI